MNSLGNKAFDGGPGGARSRDLRIKRPSLSVDVVACFLGRRSVSRVPWPAGEPFAGKVMGDRWLQRVFP
jgi:hypothetical protein